MADAIVRLKVESQEYDSKLKRAANQMSRMEQEVRRTGASFAYADKEEIAFVQSIGQMGTQAQSSMQKLREYSNAIMSLTETYRAMTAEEKNSDFGKAMAASIDELKAKAANLKDIMADTQAEIKRLASDTGVFDQVAGGITAVTSAFQVGQGAMQAFGVKSEDAMQAMARLQGVMAVTNGLTKIQAALQKESAMMIGIINIQKKAQAAAEALDTKMKTGNIAATKAATVAQKALNAVAKAHPFMLLAGAIGAVVGAFSLFGRGASKAAEDQKKLAEQSGQTMGSLMTTYTILQEEWKNLSTEQEKSDWLENNKDKFNELGIAINSVADAQKVLIDQSGKVIESFQLQAEAAALQSLAEEKYKEYYENLAKNKDKMVKAGDSLSYSQNISTESLVLAQKGYLEPTGVLGMGGYKWTEKGAEAYNKELLGTGKEDADNFINQLLEKTEVLNKTYDELGVKSSKGAELKIKVTYDEGELGQLQEKLNELRQEQQHAIDNAEFNVIQKDIDAVQKQIDAITGKTAKNATKELTPLQEAQKKITELTNEALTADEGRREAIRLEIEDLQKQVAEYQKIQDYVQGINQQTEPKELNPEMRGPEMSAFEKAQQGIRTQIADQKVEVDQNAFTNLLTVAIQNGIDSLNPNFEALQYKLGESLDIPDEDWKALADEINEQLKNLGLDPIKLDVKTGNVEELGEKVRSVSDNVNGAISVFGQLGQAMQDIDDPGAKVAGIIMEAIANVAGAFAKSLMGTFDPWSFIAASIAGVSTMISTVAAIKQVTSGNYASGGIIPGNSFSGDNMRGVLPNGELVGLNSGELILNTAQQGAVASALQNNNPFGNLALSMNLKGEDIQICLDNNRMRRGR